MKRILLAALLLASAFEIRAAEGPQAATVRQRARAWRSAHEASIVEELAALLALPNVASDKPNIERNAAAVEAALRRRGVATELLRVPDAPPVVFGELSAPGARRTIVLYVHYDGQPVVPSQWTGDPWKPILRDKPLEEGGREVPMPAAGPIDPEWRLYGRSASDDKAPIVALLAALDALKDARIPLSANFKFFLEGEEEAGSPHLEQFLETYSARLKGDLWLLFDGPVHQSRRMQVYFGARGVTGVELTAFGPTRRLHSGHYGNWAPNPGIELARLLSTMRDDEGQILIPGFLDDVRKVTETERKALAAAPDVDAELRKELGIAKSEGSESLLESLMRPALNIRGLSSGDVGAKATNSIPTEASASIDLRLVPDQTPERVKTLFEDHVRRQGFTIIREDPNREARAKTPRLLKVAWNSGGYPSGRTSMDLPVSGAVVRTIEASTGGPIVRLPTLGGSIPMYLFLEKLKTPVVGIPIVNHDNNQHAANENLRIQNLWDGIETCAALLARLGVEWK